MHFKANTVNKAFFVFIKSKSIWISLRLLMVEISPAIATLFVVSNEMASKL